MGIKPDIFPVFVAVWFALGIGSTCYFLINKNAAQKRKVFPRFMACAYLLFVGFMALIAPVSVLFFAPAAIAFYFINLQTVKFCDACGRTLFNQNPFTPPAYCSKCGTKLEN